MEISGYNFPLMGFRTAEKSGRISTCDRTTISQNSLYMYSTIFEKSFVRIEIQPLTGSVILALVEPGSMCGVLTAFHAERKAFGWRVLFTIA